MKYFMKLIENMIEGVENARCDYEDVQNMEDSMSVRMVLSGIPLE